MKASRAAGRRRSRQAGHTLIEWLVAAALGLVVLSGSLSLYRSQRETFERAADAAGMREAGAAALMLVGGQIQMAGYAPIDRPALRTRVMPGVFGCESSRPGASSLDESACAFQSSDATDSDGIVVRYVDDAVATWPSRSGEPTDCLGQAVGRQGEHAVVVNRFYAARSARREAPELYCIGNGRPEAPQPIVEGIERVMLRYWVRGAARPVRAEAVAPEQWADVVAVDLCVVVRGRRARAGAAAPFVDCNGNRVPSPGGRERMSLSRHLVLRNHGAVS